MEMDTHSKKKVTQTKGGNVVPTKLYRKELACLEEQLLYPDLFRPIIYTGAKGVGKSTLLKELHSEMKKKTECYYGNFAIDDAAEIEKGVQMVYDNKGKGKGMLFIDNIQVAAETDFGVKLLRSCVKSSPTDSKAFLVAASSRAGLLILSLSSNRVKLSAEEFLLRVVNPEKEVGEAIAKQYIQEEQVYNKLTNTLQTIGYLPASIKRMAELFHLEVDSENVKELIDKFISSERSYIADSLDADRKTFFGMSTEHKQSYAKTLLMCACGGISQYQFFDAFGLSMMRIPWTHLKQTETDSIQAVSPLVQEVINKVLVTKEEMITVLSKCIKDKTSLGTYMGNTFELLIKNALSNVLKFSYVKSNLEPVTVDISTIMEEEEIRSTYLSTEMVFEKNYFYSTPNMENCDFVLKTDEREVYFIQASVSANIAKYKDFWATAREGWCVLLVTPRQDIHEYLMTHTSQLARGFQADKFGIIDIKSVILDHGILELFN